MRFLNDYRDIVGDKVISDIIKAARPLYGKRVIHINSTFYGGGVAEMLTSLVPLMNDVGLDAGWRIIRGAPEFFSITKKFHNALQGDEIHLTDIKKRLYKEINEDFAYYTHINHDAVVIHDPQPLPLINFYKKRQPWIWRGHIDLSHPNPELWKFLTNFILKYDVTIVSHEKYKNDLPMEYKIIHPAIDPLSNKNHDMSATEIREHLEKFQVPNEKPMITQISRFDKWKDPLGVLEIYKLVKKEVDCRLILCGSMAPDDPEGIEIYQEVQQRAANLIESGDVTLLTLESNFLVNALQRASSVVIQKSLREGFGLTVTEAMWKKTPVVASNVGGIPLQIQDGENGYLAEPDDIRGFADRVIHLLKNPDKAGKIGERAHESVRQNFLITRILQDYLDLFNDLLVAKNGR
ncbi:glycosyltransferase [candidate division KSB1 bacterium]|nr:glycosyltransferase [candidate division KSB1 bacterium]